jgi:hypothetical protein
MRAEKFEVRSFSTEAFVLLYEIGSSKHLIFICFGMCGLGGLGLDKKWGEPLA